LDELNHIIAKPKVFTTLQNNWNTNTSRQSLTH